MKPIYTLLLLPIFFGSCSKELKKEDATKIISQYYQLPFQTKIAIDVIYEGYGWPPEKYKQLENQGFVTIEEINGSLMWKRYRIKATEAARQYWIQNGTFVDDNSEKKKLVFVFKGYKFDIKDVSVSSNAKENKAEAEVVFSMSDVSPIQSIFSPLEQTEVKKTLNFKLFDDGWKIVEDDNSKNLVHPISAPNHWMSGGHVDFDNTPLVTVQTENLSSSLSRNDTATNQTQPNKGVSIKDTGNNNLVVTPQNEKGGFGKVTFSKNGKTLFFYELATKKGKIVINKTSHVLNKCSSPGNTTFVSYKLTGDQISITAPNSKVVEIGDCFHSKCPKVTIILNGMSTTINDVDVMDCQSAGGD